MTHQKLIDQTLANIEDDMHAEDFTAIEEMLYQLLGKNPNGYTNLQIIESYARTDKYDV